MEATTGPSRGGPCPVCGGVAEIDSVFVRGFCIAVCGRCSLGWLCDAKHPGAGFYGEEYFLGGRETVGYRDYLSLAPALRLTARLRLRRIKRILGRAGGRLLEVGCGPGFFLEIARDAGFLVQGLELSAFAARYARDALNLPVLQGDILAAQLASQGFDVVAMWDVLEHLSDPHSVMDEIARVLSRGGGLAFSTGDRTALLARLAGPRWHLYNLPEHLFFYSPESLRELLATHGFEVRAMRREAAHYPLGYLAERLEKTIGVPLPPLGPLKSVCLPVNLGDILTVYAVRR